MAKGDVVIRNSVKFVEALEPVYSAATPRGHFVLFLWDGGWAVAYGETEQDAMQRGRKSALISVLG